MADLVRTEAPVTEDTWQRIEGEFDPAALPIGALLLPLAGWLAHRDSLRDRPDPLGVWLAADDRAESLAGALSGLAVIAIHFPVFSDGRGYSNARILRERLGWNGELRAIGDVLRDQLFLMRRCGFDSFALRPDRDAVAAQEALADFRHAYQHATVDPGTPLLERT